MAETDLWDGEERRRDPVELLAERTAELAATRRSLESVGDQVSALTEAAAQLASKEEVKAYDSHARRRSWLLAAIVLVLVGLPGAALLIENSNASDQRERLIAVSENVLRVNSRLDDCLQPQGRCALASRARQERFRFADQIATVAVGECLVEQVGGDGPVNLKPCVEARVDAEMADYDRTHPIPELGAAGEQPEPQPKVEPKEETVDQLVEVRLNEDVVQLLVAFVIPLLVALATKFKSSSGLKAVLNLALTVLVTALLNVVDAGGTFVVNDFLNDLARNFALSIATYYGLWKSTGVAGSIAVRTGGFGLGSPPALETASVGLEDVGEALAAADAHEDTGAAAAAVAVLPEAQLVEIVEPLEVSSDGDHTDPVGMRVGTSESELAAQARLLGIPGRSKMRKGELRAAVEAALMARGQLID